MESGVVEGEKVGFVHGHICEAGPGVENTNGVGRHLREVKSQLRDNFPHV